MAKPETNTVNHDKARHWFKALRGKYDELASETGSHMARCKKIRGDIKDMKERAASDGVPKKQLGDQMKIFELRVRERKVVADYDADDRVLFEELSAALADVAELPLFGKAIEVAAGKASVAEAVSAPANDDGGDKPKRRLRRGRAEADAPGGGDERDLRPRHLREADEARATENAAEVERGVKPLN